MIGSLCLLLSSIATAGAAEPPLGIAVGWGWKDGHVLLGELNCVACHTAPGDRLLVRQAPVLAEVGSRVTPQYLRAFLAEPQKVKAGTPMPDLLHGLPAKERDETIDALVHYLTSLGPPLQQRASGASLSQIERGKELYHTAGCVACHSSFAPPPRHKVDPANPFGEEDPAKPIRPQFPPVPFGDLALKTTVEALARFLDDPLHVRPSGRMPQLHLKPGEASLLAAYLLRDQYTEKEKAPGAGLDFAYFEGSWKNVPAFDKLTPKLQGDAKDFDLAAVLKKGKTRNTNFAVRFQGLIDVPRDGKYRFWTKSDDGSVLRIDGKVVVNNDGIHSPKEAEGTVELKKGRHTIEVGIINGGGGYELSVSWQLPSGQRGPIPSGILLHSAGAMIPKDAAEFTIDKGKVERGKQLFGSLGCASCHVTDRSKPDQGPKLKAPELAKLDAAAEGGCVGERTTAGRPRFALNDEQRKAVREALGKRKQPVPVADARAQVEQRMASLGCYACHPRDGKGGPDAERAKYFAYEIVVDLGDEGRLPPALDGVGAKLTTAGFDDALFSGKRYRSYMATRMPNFGKANVGDLPELFAKADAGKVPPHQPATTRKLIDDGRRLVGKNTLACVNCHAWGNLRVSGAEGLDLLQVPRRLQPNWFHAFLQDPQRFRPGTRMPGAFVDGKSLLKDVLDGDMHKQIDAMWAYLSVGEKGGLPAGLSGSDTALLVPTDEPIVFRTFLDQVGAHSILVGFKERTNVAFDANRVRMVEAWTGDFISTKAAWDGRAGQYAKVPGSNLLRFPEGPPFARLDSPTAAWPADPQKAGLGSMRTPAGWRFLGYRYDEKRVPVFLYAIDKINVEETPGTDIRPEAAYLSRRFRLSAEEDVPNLYLRVAAGKKIVGKDGQYTVDGGPRYRVISTSDLKPLVRDIGGGQELLVPVRFGAPAGGKNRQPRPGFRRLHPGLYSVTPEGFGGIQSRRAVGIQPRVESSEPGAATIGIRVIDT